MYVPSSAWPRLNRLNNCGISLPEERAEVDSVERPQSCQEHLAELKVVRPSELCSDSFPICYIPLVRLYAFWYFQHGYQFSPTEELVPGDFLAPLCHGSEVLLPLHSMPPRCSIQIPVCRMCHDSPECGSILASQRMDQRIESGASPLDRVTIAFCPANSSGFSSASKHSSI